MEVEINNITRNCYRFEITEEEWNSALADDNEWYQQNKDTDKVCFFLDEMKGWLEIFNRYSFQELNDICQKNAQEPTAEGNKIVSAVQDFLQTHFITNYHYQEEDLVDCQIIEEEVDYDWSANE